MTASPGDYLSRNIDTRRIQLQNWQNPAWVRNQIEDSLAIDGPIRMAFGTTPVVELLAERLRIKANVLMPVLAIMVRGKQVDVMRRGDKIIGVAMLTVFGEPARLFRPTRLDLPPPPMRQRPVFKSPPKPVVPRKVAPTPRSTRSRRSNVDARVLALLAVIAAEPDHILYNLSAPDLNRLLPEELRLAAGTALNVVINDLIARGLLTQELYGRLRKTIMVTSAGLTYLTEHTSPSASSLGN